MRKITTETINISINYFLFTKSKIYFSELFLNNTNTAPYTIIDITTDTTILTHRLDMHNLTK